jgi:hypothetical protein
LIAVDTNILIYAHRSDSPWHSRAAARLRELAEGDAAWAIPWPCVHEFLAIVTHPRVYQPPSTAEQALRQVEAWLESPWLHLLGEASTHWRSLRLLVADAQLSGLSIPDARVAAICLTDGVRVFWTADRDVSRIPELRTHNPLRSEPVNEA